MNYYTADELQTFITVTVELLFYSLAWVLTEWQVETDREM